MDDSIQALKSEALETIGKANSEGDLEDLRIKYLGRKGAITGLLRDVGSASAEDRPRLGQALNALKGEITEATDVRSGVLAEERRVRQSDEIGVDVTLPGPKSPVGHLHPVTRAWREMVDILSHMGFDVATGPEVETEHYNFEALNIPAEHPARDMQDTFFVEGGHVLRTHTSPVQIRAMEKMSPPLQIISPGRVYRCDSDISHTPMFHQVEGFMVDKDISLAHLKGVLTTFIGHFFNADISLRLRPSYFPFVEPGAEIDIKCVLCSGNGCRTCSQTGWLEVGGCGMIHPKVFESVHYDPEEWTGFAFGLGIDRFAMLKYGISDLRTLFENDIRFLSQF